MKISFKRSWLVKPAEQTFQGYLPLSVWDQIGCVTHIPAIYFYNPGPEYSPDSIINSLENSLSKVLVHFYPLAGRLRCLGGGRLEVDCNAAGVELVEAESTGKLSDFGDFSTSHKFNHHLFPCVDYEDIPFEQHPLLYVQLTKFQCGGISLSCTMSHAVADGLSAVHFISEWARIARGEALRIKPTFDRTPFKTNNYSPKSSLTTTPLFQHDQYFQLLPVLIGESDQTESERKKPTSIAVLKLTKTQVETLKKKANNKMKMGGSGEGVVQQYPYTRYEVIAAHTWRSACKARNLLKEQPTSLGLCVDTRKRMKPGLPKGYFGNAIVDVIAGGKSGELVSHPLSYAASKIREAVLQVSNEYIHSAIEFMENQIDISKFQDIYAVKRGEGVFYGNPNLVAVSWLSLPLYNIDFGWGKEVYMSLGSHESDGDCVIIPGKEEEDGCLSVALCIQDTHIDDFRKFFYADITEEDCIITNNSTTVLHDDIYAFSKI